MQGCVLHKVLLLNGSHSHCRCKLTHMRVFQAFGFDSGAVSSSLCEPTVVLTGTHTLRRARHIACTQPTTIWVRLGSPTWSRPPGWGKAWWSRAQLTGSTWTPLPSASGVWVGREGALVARQEHGLWRAILGQGIQVLQQYISSGCVGHQCCGINKAERERVGMWGLHM